MSYLDESIQVKFGDCIKAFLKTPDDRRRFGNFYTVCLKVMIGYLTYLRSRGYRLPAEKAERENPLIDVAHDLLGGLLRNPKEAPFFVIFDFYRRRGVVEFESEDPKELFWQFTVLLRGYAKKALSRLASERSPQSELLKRRFKDILREPGYARLQGPNNRRDLITAEFSKSDLREDKPMITGNELEGLVEAAFIHSTNRREWCRKIFEMLDQNTEVRNCLCQNDLLAAIVAVNIRHLELYGWRPSPPTGPEDIITDEILAEAKGKAIVYVKGHSLSRFCRGGRLTDSEAGRFIEAVDHYLTDMSHDGDPDSIPEYFRLVMPKEKHRLYLAQYKYCFEAVINEALAEFRRILKE